MIDRFPFQLGSSPSLIKLFSKHMFIKIFPFRLLPNHLVNIEGRSTVLCLIRDTAAYWWLWWWTSVMVYHVCKLMIIHTLLINNINSLAGCYRYIYLVCADIIIHNNQSSLMITTHAWSLQLDYYYDAMLLISLASCCVISFYSDFHFLDESHHYATDVLAFAIRFFFYFLSFIWPDQWKKHFIKTDPVDLALC